MDKQNAVSAYCGVLLRVFKLLVNMCYNMDKPQIIMVSERIQTPPQTEDYIWYDFIYIKL